VTMSAVPEPCTRCGRPFGEADTPDPHGWCADCRARVVRTSSRAALLPAVGMALLLGWLLLRLDLLESRWVIGLLALAGLLVWTTFKVARRVAFEVVSSRIRRRRARA
jgi:hypothetical protein